MDSQPGRSGRFVLFLALALVAACADSGETTPTDPTTTTLDCVAAGTCSEAPDGTQAIATYAWDAGKKALVFTWVDSRGEHARQVMTVIEQDRLSGLLYSSGPDGTITGSSTVRRHGDNKYTVTLQLVDENGTVTESKGVMTRKKEASCVRHAGSQFTRPLGQLFVSPLGGKGRSSVRHPHCLSLTTRIILISDLSKDSFTVQTTQRFENGTKQEDLPAVNLEAS